MMNAKRKNIVDAATRLFAEDGYHAVGMDRIIKESGVAKMTMYRNFPTKDDLVSEVLSQRAHQALASMTDAVSKQTCPFDRLQEVFAWHDRWFKSRDFSGCMFVGALSEFRTGPSEIVRVTSAQKIGLRLFLQNLLLDLVPNTFSEHLSRQLVMLLDGAIVSAMAGDREHAAADAWSIAEKLIRGIETKHSDAVAVEFSAGARRRRSK